MREQASTSTNASPHAKRHRNAAVVDDPFADGSKFLIQIQQIPRNNERDAEKVSRNTEQNKNIAYISKRVLTQGGFPGRKDSRELNFARTCRFITGFH